MKNYKLVVMSRPVAGKEDQYNDWYQNQHLHDVTDIDSIQSAQRFKLVRSLNGQEFPPYLAIYDIEADDVEDALRDIKRRARTEQMPIDEALADDAVGLIYEEAGPPVRKRAS